MTQTAALLTASDVARLLNTSADTVRRWARDKQLPSVVLPSGGLRFRRADIDALINSTRTA